MPNHCSNRTAVTGPQEDLERFMAVIKWTEDFEANEEFGLKSLWPCPQELRETAATHATAEPHPNWAVMLANGEMTQERYDELVETNAKNWTIQQANKAKYGFTDWYDWCNSNWGTKWGDYDHYNPEVFDGMFAIFYSTAWAPYQDLFWHKVSLDWPTLTFVTTYDEPGMAFYGAIGAHNGQVVDVSDDYPEIDWGNEAEAETAQDIIAEDLDRFAAEVMDILSGD